MTDRGDKEDAEAEPERQQWDSPVEFLLSCISMSVGQYQHTQLYIDRYLILTTSLNTRIEIPECPHMIISNHLSFVNITELSRSG